MSQTCESWFSDEFLSKTSISQWFATHKHLLKHTTGNALSPDFLHSNIIESTTSQIANNVMQKPEGSIIFNEQTAIDAFDIGRENTLKGTGAKNQKRSTLKCSGKTIPKSHDDGGQNPKPVKLRKTLSRSKISCSEQKDADADHSTCALKKHFNEAIQNEVNTSIFSDADSDAKRGVNIKWFLESACNYTFPHDVGQKPSGGVGNFDVVFRGQKVSHFKACLFVKRMPGGCDVGNTSVCKLLAKKTVSFESFVNARHCTSTFAWQKHVCEKFSRTLFRTAFVNADEDEDRMIYWKDLYSENKNNIEGLCCLIYVLFSDLAKYCSDPKLEMFFQEVLKLALAA